MFRLAAALAMISFALDVCADWQYTRWGMTVDEVAKASNGLAQPYTEASNPKYESAMTARVLLRAPYKAGDFNFTADFLFGKSDDRLARVILRLDGANDIQCARLQGSLKDVYGTPSEVSRSSMMPTTTWRDAASGINVLYSSIGTNYCSVNYSPLATKAKSGL